MQCAPNHPSMRHTRRLATRGLDRTMIYRVLALKKDITPRRVTGCYLLPHMFVIQTALMDTRGEQKFLTWNSHLIRFPGQSEPTVRIWLTGATSTPSAFSLDLVIFGLI